MAETHNLREYLIGVGEWIPAIQGDGDRLHRAVCLAVLRPCIFGTPVDTGFHRGNWQVSNEGPPTETVERRDVRGRETLAIGYAEVLRARAGEVTWIVNNGPAIIRLEEGHSRQNKGWVAAAVQEARQIVPPA